MKHMLMISGVFLIMSFICRIDSIAGQPDISANDDSIKSAAASNDISIVSPIIKGEINLVCGVLDPVNGRSQISGKVSYIHHTLQNVAGITRIKVNLELNAHLCSKLLTPVKNSIYGSTVDTVSFNAVEKVLLDKYYGVLYRPDLRVFVQYLITPVGIGIMKLDLLQISDRDI